MPFLRLALAQLNVTVGDVSGNTERIRDAVLRAKAWRADLVVLPELAVTGYPPEDLLLKPAFVRDNLDAIARIARTTEGIVALVGYVDRDRRGRLYNAAAVLADRRLIASYHKQCLPNYGVFDEQRYFTPGEDSLLFRMGVVRVGVTICEDLWQGEPVRHLARQRCQLLLNLSASPYHAGKAHERRALFAERARSGRMAIGYCNLVGGQDELVFDGASLVLTPEGRVVANGWQCREDLVLADLEVGSGPAVPELPPIPPTRRPALPPLEEIYGALVLGTRDYVRKNKFETVVLGLSGGIDSSLVACLAVDALGPERVVGVVMPSRFSSAETQEDARRLARNLGIRCDELPIETCFEAFLKTLEPVWSSRPADTAEQNVQARIRGTLLMALSNKFGWLVLTTGNKSEMATGYCTLYGDMAGGFALIKDVPKTLVYQLSRLRQRRGGAGPIPERVFTRAPTAELAFNQTDQDTLPPYETLDAIVKAYV
ncbi:MAG: NAD+ synthase, partial [Candidatus Omnitrophica bacterium]|nr:NAD+ synthase [Candidatus Omnitrophota bacterium]